MVEFLFLVNVKMYVWSMCKNIEKSVVFYVSTYHEVNKWGTP